MIDDQWLAGQLRAAGLVDEVELGAALAGSKGDLCTRLVRNGFDESKLLQFLGVLVGTRYITTEKLGQANIPQWVLDLVPVEVCEELLVVPVRCDRQRTVLSVVTPDPGDTNALESVKRIAGVRDVQAHIALLSAVEAALRKWYKGDIHGFARLERLEPQFSDLLETYDQRLIDFDAAEAPEPPEPPPGLPRPPRRTAPAPAAPAPAAATEEPRFPAEATLRFPAMKPAQPPSADGGTANDLALSLAAELIQLVELDQGWRRGHSVAVARIAGALARRLGLPAEEEHALRLAALCHEIGKPAEPHLTVFSIDSGARARAIAEQVHLAPVKLLARTNLPPAVAVTLAAIYERPAGDGIPGRLSGDHVPRTAMLLAAIDAYVDLVDRERLAPDHAIAELQQGVAPLLTPDDLAALCELLVNEPTARSAPLRVLVVDGDLVAAQVLELELVSAGFVVERCGSTADAARVVIGEGTDVVITEVELGPVDGFEFIQRLRADARTRDLPVIVMTNRQNSEDEARAHELNAVEYAVKPYTAEALLTTVERIFGDAPSPNAPDTP